MTTIEESYKNAKVIDNKLKLVYPSFIAKKQLKLISDCFGQSFFESEFEQALASYFNNIWKNLLNEDKQQIKEILLNEN